jgi:hypothetical protein
VSSAATNVRNALQGLAKPAATADLALDQPTAREQLSTALSQTALSPLQAALAGEAPVSPLRLEMDRMNTALLDGPPKQEDPKQEEAAAALDPRTLRETALAAGSRNKEQRVTRQTLTMGNGQYDELSPEQRAAVDCCARSASTTTRPPSTTSSPSTPRSGASRSSGWRRRTSSWPTSTPVRWPPAPTRRPG